MRCPNSAALPLAYASICLAIQFSRRLIPPVNNVSSISSIVYRHIGYIDQKVRQNAYTFLNHESWHQRNVIAAPSNASLGPSNITSDEIAVDEAFLLPASSPRDNSSNGSSSSSPSDGVSDSDLPDLLQSTTALTKESGADATWDNQTDVACVAALGTLNGVASNPSGLAACYNIRSYDNLTGMFQADLRLFQISAPAENWTHLEPSSETLDVEYAAAEIIKSKNMEKRDSYLVVHPAEMVKSESLDKRSVPIQPKMLQGMSFLGMIKGDFLIETINESMIRSILTPNITFSGSTHNGATISIQLSDADASFVNGLFVDHATANNELQAPGSRPANIGFEYPDTVFKGFPTDFIITSVWALLLMMIMGYSAMTKIQARESYRRRMRSKTNGGTGGIQRH